MPLKELQIPETRQMLSANHKCTASPANMSLSTHTPM